MVANCENSWSTFVTFVAFWFHLTSPQLSWTCVVAQLYRKCWSCFLRVWMYCKAVLLGYHCGFELCPEPQFDLCWYELFCMCDAGSQSPNIQACFSQGSLNTLLRSHTTNHFEARVTQGCNMTLIYHTWYEIKPEKLEPHEHFLGVRFKGVQVLDLQTPYLSSSLQKP